MVVMTGRTSAQSLADIPTTSTLEDLKPELKEKPKQRTHVTHTVISGDTLVSIGKEHKTSWRRLYDANKAIKHPDIINVGQKIRIPAKNEKLASRKLPANHSNNAVKAPTSNIPQSNKDGLIGSIGYATCGGNCVNTAKAHGKNQPGNPDTWVASTQTPFIGAAALFHYQHVGIVVGIWSNGDLEIAHENYCGGQHRFNPSEFRGFF